ncbi:MAG: sterol desaturase family protein [Saprospirales bacterium]|nr:sterol desaturase family protein [Saprospirales bacterium]MBK8489425.1 sterol desaturase family protein [Saprospirales bacterium]
MEPLTILALFLFFTGLVIEYYFARKERLANSFDQTDVLNNVILGGLTFVFKMIFIKGSVLAAFVYFHQFALFDIGNQWWAWVLLFLLNDLLFYFFHRWSHEIRILWASHSVHHSSELFNLSTSIRGCFIIMLYRFAMWFPLAAIGFDPVQILLMDSIAFYYQFPIHTNTMRSWGILEYVLNTPSHHRVHHASNPQYLDKNYGAVLILWDKLFGTFAKEEEPVVFGLTTNIQTKHPLKVAFFEWVAMCSELIRARSGEEVFHILFAKPGWKKEAKTYDQNKDVRLPDHEIT